MDGAVQEIMHHRTCMIRYLPVIDSNCASQLCFRSKWLKDEHDPSQAVSSGTNPRCAPVSRKKAIARTLYEWRVMTRFSGSRCGSLIEALRLAVE